MYLLPLFSILLLKPMRILSIGTLTRDLFLESPLFKVVRDKEHLSRLGFPDGEAQCFALGAKIEVKGMYTRGGGGAGNSAVTFVRQGHSVDVLARIGSDEGGLIVRDELRKERVGLSRVIQDKKSGTASSVILHAERGERTILHYRGASENLRKEDIPDMSTYKGVYIVPGNIKLPIIKAAILKAKAARAIVALNPSHAYLEPGLKRLQSLYRLADVLLMNKEEAALLLGRDGSTGDLMRELLRGYSGLAVITDGPRGSCVSDGAKMWRAEIFKEKKIADRTGAGDAFGSAFFATLVSSRKSSSGWDKSVVREAVRRASANAASVVESLGARPGILSKTALSSVRWRNLRMEEISLR